MTVLVCDAGVALSIADSGEVGPLGGADLVAPPLLFSEVRSVLHELAWRGARTPERAQFIRRRFEAGPISERRHESLGDRAWEIAEQLGWAKTYDAEYVALATLLDCQLVTLDGRLRRGADRLGGVVIAPDELESSQS